MSDDRNKFQIAGLFPPWERSSFGNALGELRRAIFRRSVVSPSDEKTRYDAKASRPTRGRRRRTAVFSSSSPFFGSRRTFFLLYYVNRLKIVLTLTLYPFSPVNFNVFSTSPLDADQTSLSITPIAPILTSYSCSPAFKTQKKIPRKPKLPRDNNPNDV